MEEFPDPDDEYELLHQDELDILREHDEDIDIPYFSPKKSRVSLNFDFETKKKEDNSSNDISSETTPSSQSQLKRKLIDLDLDGIEVLEKPTKRTRPSESDVLGSPLQNHFNEFGITSLSYPPWNFLTVNTVFGERLYVRLRGCNTKDEQWVSGRTKVSESFLKLKENVMQKLESQKENKENDTHQDVILDESVEKADLWVEKFKPKKYLELLSDEGVNRTLLNWIKMWDKVVFNRERFKKLQKQEVPEKAKKAFKPKQEIQDEKVCDLDDDGRPFFKIALLCGSPGIGKTTLAHVIAALAGYNVIEVNASDDRSIDAFRNTLENATQMQSVMGSKKPNCLILDEIDGAPAPSIDFLLKFINGKVSEKVKKGKKEKGIKTVKRPVICICNELYTPSLRQLRQQAYVIHFPQTSSSKLAQRLVEICKKQSMKTDLSTMTLLCDKAHRDIRSCITTLHFFKSKNEKSFKAADVAKASVGLKDFQKNLFSVWQDIFHKKLKKDSGFGESDSGAHEYDYHPEEMKRLQGIVQTLQSCGDYEKLQQGVHENMLKLRYPRQQAALLKGTEWFCWTDLLDTRIRHDQNFMLMPYIPYAFAACHFLFSTTNWPKIAYPSVGFENHLKTTKNTQILNDVLRGLNPMLRAHTQRKNLLLDVLPLLPPILTPHLRPVNIKLFNDKEKAEFAHLLDVMIDFNMNYLQQRHPDGTYFYSFDPSFEEVTQFSLKERPKVTEFSYNMKQIISREVELERLRRSDLLHSSGANDHSTDNAKSTPVEESKPKSAKKPLQLQPKPKPIENNEPGQYKDFFGRIVQVERPTAARNGLDKSNFIKSKVWYCYKEGFNNAVKKDLTIADLL